jgi:endonuclease III
MKSISHKPNLALDFDKSVEIAHILVSGFLKRKGIFNDQKELVENQLPRGVQPLSKEHALFLFHIITLDYGTRSARLYENGKLLFVQHPELFNPAEVLEMGIDKVRELVVNNIGARFPNEATLRWYQNSKKLLKEYDGDPRNIFRISSDAEDVFKRVREFRGLGRKTGALLLRAFSNLGFAKLENLDKVLVPVDIHDTRIAFFTHCVRGSQNPETYVKDYSRYVKCVSELTWTGLFLTARCGF